MCIEESRIQGFLTYRDGNPVGWCNAVNRNDYPALHRLMRSGPDDFGAGRLNRMLRSGTLAPESGSSAPSTERLRQVF